MGSLKKINSTQSSKGTAKAGGSLVRISTGEKIKYNEDPERSLSKVSDAQKQAAEGRYQAYVSSSRNATSNRSDTAKNEPYELWRNASAPQTNIPIQTTNTTTKRSEQNPSILERVLKTVSGGLKQSAGGTIDSIRTLYEAHNDSDVRDMNQEAWRNYQNQADRFKAEYEEMLSDNQRNPGTWSTQMLENYRMRYENAKAAADNLFKANNMDIQSGTSKAVADISDSITESAANDIERAKQGGNFATNVLVDAGASLTQVAGDIMANQIIGAPGSMIPFAARAFGGATQKARQEGADIKDQIAYGGLIAAKEVFTEKMFNIAAPYAKAYGKGFSSVEDSLEKGIRKAVDKFAKTEAGARALGGALTFGASSITEGLEELIGDWMEWQLPRIYGGDVATAGETLSDSLYDFLVGSVSGGFGSVMDSSTWNYDTTNVRNSDEKMEAQNDAGEKIASPEGSFTHADKNSAERVLGGNAEVRQETYAETSSGHTNAMASEQGYTIDRSGVMETAKNTLGKEGFRAFEAAYRDTDNPGQEYGELTRAYNDGMANRKTGSQLLTEGQYEVMYEAGRADAASSVRAQVQNVKNVTSYGRNSGIDYNDSVTSEYIAQNVDGKTAHALDTVAKKLGVQIRFADQVAGGNANAQIQNGIITIEKGNPNPLRFLFGHEITHRMQELAPQEYARLREAVAAEMEGGDAAIKNMQANYARHDMSISNDAAMDEAVADYVGKLLEDDGELERFVQKYQNDRTMLERLRDAFRALAEKLNGMVQGKQAQSVEQRLTKLLDASVKQADQNAKAQKNTAQDGGVKYSLNPGFAKQFDAWVESGKQNFPGSGRFLVGTTSEALKSIGVSDYQIYWSSAKIAKIMKKHPSMTSDVIKSVPNVLENPILVMQSQTVANRITLFGEAMDADGKPVLVAVELSPQNKRGEVQDFAVIASAYGKNGAQQIIDNSDILYVEPDKKRTDSWLGLLRLQLPSRLTKYGSISNVALVNRDVNGNISFGESGKTAMQDAFEKAQELKKKKQDDMDLSAGIAYDSATESVSPAKFSMKTWNASDYVQERKKAAGEMASVLGISQKKAMDYIDSVNSIAKIIADDRVRLDYEASPGRSSFVGNVEYGGSIDFSTVCKKRRLFTGTFEAIQNALPNTALTAEEILEIRSMMDKKGYEVSCGLCYVEGSRANMGQYAKQFLEQYAQTNPAYLPNMAEINTPNGLEKIRIQHPDVYAAYESFMNKLAQRKPKLYQLSTEYQGEILNKFRKKNGQVKSDDVASKNANGGIRLQSFSDFEIIHLIDSMQVIMDMSRVGLAGQAYTKVPDFAWALGDTGLKINLSLIAKDVDRNGKLILDEKEGMSEKDAMALRDRYSKNVGTIVVVFTDRQLKAAMADERIDYIIPFHRSQWNKGQYEAMGLPANAKDFTSWQNEAYINPVYNEKGKKQRPDNYMPNTYWDFSKSGKENAEAYLKMCAENNRRPKFHYLLVDNKDGSYSLQPDGSTDGYWKTLIDFKMYDNDGKGSPQLPVRPDFNMEQAQRMLNEYTGGHNAFPAAQDIVDEFVSKYKKSHEGAKFSLKDSESLAREIAQIRKDGKKNNRSQEDIDADVRNVVDDAYQSMLQAYGVIKPGENPYRDVQVPERTSKDKKVSQTVRTILEAQATPDAALPKIEEMVATGDFSYDVYTDKEAIADAESKLKHDGWAQALTEWTASMQRGEVSKQNTAMGWALYNNAANDGDVKTAMTVLDYMVRHQRNAAQAVQATRILKKLSPDTQLYHVQRSVESLQEELNKRYGNKKSPKLKVDEDLAGRYMQAKNQDERDEVLKDIYRDIGRQMPSNFRDKWNAWRYLAMLGNARTHVRNIAGNAVFAPAVAVKNMTATAIESAVSRVSGGKLNRSKGMVGFSKADRALLSAAWNDFDNVQESALGGGKYSEFQNANKYIEEGREVFKFKPLEAARKGNSKALDAEDMWFSRPHYAYAMAQYCKANNITAEQIAKGKAIKPARTYAIREAQKATYRDANYLSDAVSKFGRVNDKSNPVKKFAGIVAEGVMPFKKTPANILMRGIEYSPVGLLNGIKEAAFDVRSGKKTGAEAIDAIASGLTGTGILAIGIFMAAQGLVRGAGGGDDKEKEFEKLTGHQDYSLEVGGKSYTLDWLAPESIPFFVGVNLWEATKDGGLTASEVLDTASMITEPILEMSMLQSLNDVFEKVGSTYNAGIKGLPAAIANAVTSYLTQAIPTLLGQAERTGQDVRMTTYTDKNSPLNSDMQYALGSASSRIPGFDYNQIPYIDAWGRTESSGGIGWRAFNNFLNPSYTSSIDTSDMEEELMRLYKSTGDANVFPKRASKYFTVDKERKDLTADEYVQYATLKGQKSYELLSDLVNSRQYQSMSDEEKAKAVDQVYDLANQQAKAAISEYQAQSWTVKAVEAEKKYGISQDVYISLKTQASGIQSLKDKDGKTIDNSLGLQIMEMVYNTPGLTEKQRQAMFEYLGVGSTIRHYNKALVKEKLSQMSKQAK